jgi:hypothetical protein
MSFLAQLSAKDLELMATILDSINVAIASGGVGSFWKTGAYLGEQMLFAEGTFFMEYEMVTDLVNVIRTIIDFLPYLPDKRPPPISWDPPDVPLPPTYEKAFIGTNIPIPKTSWPPKMSNFPLDPTRKCPARLDLSDMQNVAKCYNDAEEVLLSQYFTEKDPDVKAQIWRKLQTARVMAMNTQMQIDGPASSWWKYGLPLATIGPTPPPNA